MLMIRLRRMGARNSPYYRFVVSDSRRTPRGAAVEELGSYDPRAEPPKVVLDKERVGHWVGRGARLSPTVAKLLARA
jgi:small subunit ribosomal protein S16